MIERTIKHTISENLFKGKSIILTGARQVGKTTLIRDVLQGKVFLFLDGDDPLVKQQLTQSEYQGNRNDYREVRYCFYR